VTYNVVGGMLNLTHTLTDERGFVPFARRRRWRSFQCWCTCRRRDEGSASISLRMMVISPRTRAGIYRRLAHHYRYTVSSHRTDDP